MSGQEFYPMFSLGFFRSRYHINFCDVSKYQIIATIKNSFASVEAEVRERKDASKGAQKEETYLNNHIVW